MSDLPVVALLLLVTFALADFVRYFFRLWTCRHQHEPLSVLFEEGGRIVEHRICSHCGEVLS